MAKNTITLALNGEDIDIHHFNIAISNLENLIAALTKEFKTDSNTQWVVHDLQISSAIATFRGESDIMAQVEQIVEAYGDIGKSLESGKRPNYTEPVVKAAEAITSILDGNVKSLRFETAESDALIQRQTIKDEQLLYVKAYGAIEGRIQTLTNRKGLRFTLFDMLYDKAVSCYLNEEQEDLIREAWGKRAFVQGEITREVTTRRPIAIRHITQVKILSEVPQGNYLKARGIIPITGKEYLPEVVIRKIRDAA